MIFTLSPQTTQISCPTEHVLPFFSAKTAHFWSVFFAVTIACLLALRVFSVVFTTLNLGPDEAQYWRWSTNFDWGYYSKPPMIAWIIGTATSVFGNSEWAVRIASPFFHITTGVILYVIGRKYWTETTGVIAGLIYLLMPGVWLSSIIMSTDVSLLTFWSLSLFFLFRLRDGGSWRSGIALGLSIGLGFLSKYAMIYFLLGTGIALIYDKPLRTALLTRSGLFAAGILALVLTPHIIWSANNGFETISHTADNANWGASLLNPENGLKFFGDQFGVFGPVSFAILLVLLITLATGATKLRGDARVRLLLAFIIPPLTIILVQAFISRAHANWAATAYPAATLIVAVWAAQPGRGLEKWVRPVLLLGLLANTLVGLVFSYALVAPEETVNEMGFSRATKRLRGWPETTDRVIVEAARINASSIIVDEREIWHGLDYYGRDGKIPVPLRAWRRGIHPASASEEHPLTEADTQNALVLSYRKNDREKMAADFDSFEPVGDIEVDLGGGRFRRFELFQASGFNPVPRNAAEPAPQSE